MKIIVSRFARRIFGAVLVALFVTVSATTPVASAGKGFVDSFGGRGGQAGPVGFPNGVGVNQATGDVYVVDADDGSGVGGQRVAQFSADGELIRLWGWGVATGAEAFEVCMASCRVGTAGSGDGQFRFRYDGDASSSSQLAVDSVDGSVYVADRLNDRIQKFSGSGEYLDQFGGPGTGDGQLTGAVGVAVDPVSRDVYVADTGNNRVQRFDSAGNQVSTIGSIGGGSGDGEFLAPTRVAVDSAGRLYVLDSGNNRVQRFTDTGAFDGVFAAGAYNAPTELTVDPATDHVYVAGQNADFTVEGIHEFDADGNPVDDHVSNHGIADGFPAGMAVRSSTGQIYATGAVNPIAVFVLDDVAVPTVLISPVTGIGAFGATFNGDVNPEGAPGASYRFEYSIDGSSWTALPGEAIGSGTSAVTVSKVVDGLDADTEYRVRLVAIKELNPNLTATSDETTFKTAMAAPAIRPLAAGTRTDSVAWLGAEVNPLNSGQTSYYVEYTLATDTGYAQSRRVPVAPDVGTVPDGNDFVTVSELATGLRPDAQYRFRVVATNDAGTTFGADRTFSTGKASPPAPAGRGYEMVTPLDKNGGNVDRNLPFNQYSTSGAAASGPGAVAYGSLTQFGNAQAGAYFNQYRSTRTADGWVTRGISPPIKPDRRIAINTPFVPYLSEDLTKAIVVTGAQLAPGAGLLGDSWGLYLQDNAGPTSSYELLSKPFQQLDPDDDPNGVITDRFEFAGASRDMRHVVFGTYARQLTSDGLPPLVDQQYGVYMWSEGELRFVSKLPSGEPVNARPGALKGGAGQIHAGDHLISDDGNRVFFTGLAPSSNGPPGPVYVRENGTVTTPVSAPNADPDAPVRAVFQAARAEDGARALFTTEERLTDDARAQAGGCDHAAEVAGCHSDLYLWNADAPEGERVTDLTTQDPGGGGVMGVVASTDDLATVYFVAGGELAQGGVAGEPNLYVWTSGEGVRHVVTLSDQDRSVWNYERDPQDRRYRDARISMDGDRLLFTSRARLTAHDNGNTSQAYLFDLGEDRVTCVSCRPSGGVSESDAWLFYPTVYPPNAPDGLRAPIRLPRNLSADGDRVFFETGQGLVPRDTNGTVDVYMWFEGELSLISAGKGPGRSELIDASADGSDVYFTTRDQLVGFDTDNQVDVYDARVGGGFPEQEIPAECIGDGCQGPAATAPVARRVGADDAGEGQTIAGPRPAFSVRRLSAAQRRALAAGKRVTLVVRVNRSGRVLVRGTARLNGRSVAVLRASKRARRAGRVELRLLLSDAARTRLSRAGRLRVSLAVRFAGSSQPRMLSLRRPSGPATGRAR